MQENYFNMKAIIEFIINFIKTLFAARTNVQPKTEEVSQPTTVEKDAVIEEVPSADTTKEEEDEEVIIAMPSPKHIKILVDNGHGDNTAGKRSPYSAYRTKPEIDFYEYKWNREIAKPLVERLVALGYDAEILVPEVTDISLAERVRRVNAYCNQYGSSNVLLISVHANAAGDGKQWYTARGWSAYTTKGDTKSDKVAEFLYDAAEEHFKGLKIRTEKADGDRDIEANFYIIKNTYCPAVLTENFFYDNIEDVKYILSEEGREAVIQCHIDGITKYIESLG